MSDIKHVAASGVGLRDRESSGHSNSSPAHHTICTNTESTMPNGTATLPAFMLGAGEVQ
jgi:hypothetical protein